MIATNPTQTTDISLCRRALSHARHPAADIVTARIQRVYLQEVGECDPGLYRGHVTVRALCDRRVALLRRYLLESIADIISTSSTSRKFGCVNARFRCWTAASAPASRNRLGPSARLSFELTRAIHGSRPRRVASTQKRWAIGVHMSFRRE